MPLERLREIMQRFRQVVSRGAYVETGAWNLDPKLGQELLESMLLARHLDLAAHELRAVGHGHYTICSTGHESNAILGRLVRITDPSLLHYRRPAPSPRTCRARSASPSRSSSGPASDCATACRPTRS